ncbi:hypothetical protein EMIHUDRAFT_459692 [Emiliania huxleyi CCMP1516]|uniref:FHA domain-containing protein n=2 Tax=Emiliania huxleyi TaxID=2903 RepID=A0A0D3ILW7_EMIH1|nr:hypothetical protein EMIHUDRAFT_459692 [Emiliania huxleyi CCMP1516]EOD12252.1 hypothetical protein EMIHUDRAFT_459692 [Emiliania huxleyi CCMP1516]|eukprot:XP_005764681.1 hypothetical protein EMIHUDRAFT_459692 [Emiliania huxleyi CCMP1516]
MAEAASAATPPWRLHRLQDSLKLDVDAGGCTIGRAHVVGEPKQISRSHATFRPAAEGVLDVTFAGQLSFVWSAQRPREWQRLGKGARAVLQNGDCVALEPPRLRRGIFRTQLAGAPLPACHMPRFEDQNDARRSDEEQGAPSKRARSKGEEVIDLSLSDDDEEKQGEGREPEKEKAHAIAPSPASRPAAPAAPSSSAAGPKAAGPKATGKAPGKAAGGAESLASPWSSKQLASPWTIASGACKAAPAASPYPAGVPSVPDGSAAQGGVLRARFVAPPFSSLDARQPVWQERKKHWNALFDSGAGRSNTLLSAGRTSGLGVLEKADGSVVGTSLFDPVLAEVMVRWFAPRPRLVAAGSRLAPAGRPVIVLDPFAGGCVRGIVCAGLGCLYVGVDISAKQVRANQEQWQQLERSGRLGEVKHAPAWLHGDGEQIASHYQGVLASRGLPPETLADLILACPPYYDREQYNGGPLDLSMLPTYKAFLAKYQRIIAAAVSLLKPQHFACFVVGNARAKGGGLHVLLSDTLQAFAKVDCTPYNVAVLLTALGTAPQRAEQTMAAASKLVPAHQDVLVVVKGRGFDKSDARACGIRAKEGASSQSSADSQG